jgi:hypothetical protein
MRKLPAITVWAVAAAALAGTAMAAGPKSHVMDVPLPDGSVAHIEYVGEVAPKVTIAPVSFAGDFWRSRALPPVADFERIFEQLNRQMREAEQVARQPSGVPGMNIASYGSLPAGTRSVSVVTTSNGSVSCTRTTEMVSQGPGKPPKVTSKVSGECGAAGARPAQPSSARPIDHT